jgi:hypothetical protein
MHTNIFNKMKTYIDCRNSLTCNHSITDVFPVFPVKTSNSALVSPGGRIGSLGLIHPESFVRTYEDLKSYLLAANREYVGGMFDFRKFFKELIEIRRRYLYYRWSCPKGDHLFWPTAPNASFIFDSQGENYRSFVQWWYHSPLKHYKDAPIEERLYCLLYGQHFYSGLVSPKTYLDCYFVFAPKKPTVVPGDQFYAHSFGIDEGAVFDFVVRYGDGQGDYVRGSIFEALDNLERERERLAGVRLSDFGEVMEPKALLDLIGGEANAKEGKAGLDFIGGGAKAKEGEAKEGKAAEAREGEAREAKAKAGKGGLDLIVREKALLIFAAWNFLEAYRVLEYGGKRYVRVKDDRAFFSLFDSFQYMAWHESNWKWPDRGALRSVPGL